MKSEASLPEISHLIPLYYHFIFYSNRKSVVIYMNYTQGFRETTSTNIGFPPQLRFHQTWVVTSKANLGSCLPRKNVQLETDLDFCLPICVCQKSSEQQKFVHCR